MIENLLTGRLWLRDTSTGRDYRRATLADVVQYMRTGRPGWPTAIDGRWVAFEMASSCGFDLAAGGWPPDTLAKLIGVVR